MILPRRLWKFVSRYQINRWRKKGLQVADDVKLHGMPFFGAEPFLISIGKNVNMSGKVAFITHDGSTHCFRNVEKYKNVKRFGRINIFDNCFIGYGATILQDVNIGPNSIVGAGAVVVADVPPNTVVWGNPARPLMSLEAYAEKALQKTTPVDDDAYKTDKTKELLRVLPRPW